MRAALFLHRDNDDPVASRAARRKSGSAQFRSASTGCGGSGQRHSWSDHRNARRKRCVARKGSACERGPGALPTGGAPAAAQLVTRPVRPSLRRQRSRTGIVVGGSAASGTTSARAAAVHSSRTAEVNSPQGPENRIRDRSAAGATATGTGNAAGRVLPVPAERESALRPVRAHRRVTTGAGRKPLGPPGLSSGRVLQFWPALESLIANDRGHLAGTAGARAGEFADRPAPARAVAAVRTTTTAVADSGRRTGLSTGARRRSG